MTRIKENYNIYKIYTIPSRFTTTLSIAC